MKRDKIWIWRVTKFWDHLISHLRHRGTWGTKMRHQPCICNLRHLRHLGLLAALLQVYFNFNIRRVSPVKHLALVWGTQRSRLGYLSHTYEELEAHPPWIWGTRLGQLNLKYSSEMHDALNHEPRPPSRHLGHLFLGYEIHITGKKFVIDLKL